MGWGYLSLPARLTGKIHRDDHIGAPAQAIERQRIGRGAVNQDPVLEHHRPHHCRQRNGGGERGTQRPCGNATCCVDGGPSPWTRKRKSREFLEFPGHLFRQELLQNFSASTRAALPKPMLNRSRTSLARLAIRRRKTRAIVRERQHEAANILADIPAA